MRYFLFCLTTVILIGHFDGYCQKIDMKSTSVIHISTTNSLPKPLNISVQVYHVFPAYDFSEVTDSLDTDRKQAWIKCPTRTRQVVYLTVGNDQISLLMLPNDTVHVVISPKSDTTFLYSFEGKTADIQDYYLAKQQKFTVLNFAQLGLNAGMSAENLAVFKPQLDSLTQIELSFWQQYQSKHQLPEWFVRFESDNIRYQDAMLRLYMTWYQVDYQLKKQNIATNYFDFLKQLPIQNPEAKYNYYYLHFLREYIGWRNKPSKKSISNQKPPTFDQLSDQILGYDIGGLFRLWSVSASTKNNPERVRLNLATNRFPKQYDNLVAYIKEQSAKVATVLRTGDKAPIFFLTDQQDSLVSLHQFKGQIVYLCFWYAGCGGCWHEFPFENKLVAQFKNQPVKIISICTNTSPQKWQESIKKAGLKTVNLFTNQSWQKTLEEKYVIGSYPHYVLIDADGNIIENFATRPSNNVAAKINSLLDRMTSK
jgi:peroxiredoxin